MTAPGTYLNHAGTSWPKPEPVRAAVREVLDAPADAWPARFEADHRAVARAFGIEDERRLLLTPGCTSALALAVADLPWRSGERALIGAFEHHALHRPVRKLAARGVALAVVPGRAGEPVALEALEAELRRGGVRLVAMTAACNVTGELLPIASVVELAHAHGATCLVDAAQVAGWIELDVRALGADAVAFAGHKALQGPWGIGGLWVAPEVTLDVPGATCELPRPGAGAAGCAPMPGYCDAGSVDRCALAGLAAGLRWLAEEDAVARLDRARERVERVAGLAEELGFTVHGARDGAARLPIVALTHAARTTDELARACARRGASVGAGLQCAPLAHETLGTVPGGVLRISVGPTTTGDDVERALELLRDVAPS